MTASTSTSIKAIYNQRSPTYDTSSTSPFHIRQAREYIHLAALQPGFSVLELACGTGLVTILAKQSVGPTGTVIGVDFSEGMLDVARRKTRESDLEITFSEHDITDLSELELGKADVVTGASALLLMPDTLVAVTHRATMLKTGGRLLTDVVNERDVIANAIWRKVGPEVGRSLGWDGGWVESEGSLRRLFIDAGLEVEEVYMSEVYEMREYKVEDGAGVFEKTVANPSFRSFGGEEVREKAKGLFVERFEEMAGEYGVVREEIRFYMGIARRGVGN